MKKRLKRFEEKRFSRRRVPCAWRIVGRYVDAGAGVLLIWRATCKLARIEFRSS